MVADPRGAFFVETAEKLLEISSECFGLFSLLWPGGLYTVPPVLWQPGRTIGPNPNPWIHSMLPPGPIIAPAPVAHGFAGGGTIQRAVDSHIPVMFGRTPIGPDGGIDPETHPTEQVP
jgi:hypothetical protein